MKRIIILESEKIRLIKYALVATLVLWSLTCTVLALFTRNENLVVIIDNGNVRLLNEELDQEKEAMNFVEMFLVKSFTFNSKNYRTQIEDLSNYMSENLWEKSKDSIRTSIKTTEDANLNSRIKDIVSITNTNNKFHARILVEVLSQNGKSTKDLEVVLSVSKKKRSKLNPSIFEVTEYEDKETI